MGLWAKIVGGGIAEPVDAISNLIDRTFTSDEERLEARNVFAKMQFDLQKLFAVHRSPFVAGARPYVIYVCGTSLAFYYIPQAIVLNVMWVKVIIDTGELVPFPAGNFAGLWELTIAVLGLGVMRMGEKLAGKAK